MFDNIGEIESTEKTKIANLSAEQLSALGEALLDFKSHDDRFSLVVQYLEGNRQ